LSIHKRRRHTAARRPGGPLPSFSPSSQPGAGVIPLKRASAEWYSDDMTREFPTHKRRRHTAARSPGGPLPSFSPSSQPGAGVIPLKRASADDMTREFPDDAAGAGGAGDSSWKGGGGGRGELDGPGTCYFGHDCGLYGDVDTVDESLASCYGRKRKYMNFKPYYGHSWRSDKSGECINIPE